MYYKKFKTERFMCNKEGLMHLGYIFHYLNDIMALNAESYGASAEYHLNQGLAWVLVDYEVDIIRLPKSEEVLEIGTLPYSFKRMFGYRIYEFKHLGETLIKAKAKFVLIDISTKKVTKPSKAMLDLFKDAFKEPLTLDFTKINPDQPTLLKQMDYTITDYAIDVNDHMNNAYYPFIAFEGLSDTMIEPNQVHKIRVSYKKEGLKNDNLFINYYAINEGIYIEFTKHNECVNQIVLYKKTP
ncbi:MAG: acyl-[acyl-carrier-protein] thioesterase [Candidatus Izemoplasmataceae bacterium]